MQKHRNSASAAGQAIVEFVVALLAIAVLFAGLLQIAKLTLAHTETMNEARRDAAMQVVQSTSGGPLPDFIAAWEDGPDGFSYSADDVLIPGDVDTASRIADNAKPQELTEKINANRISQLKASPGSMTFGFVEGYSKKTVPVLPLMRETVCASDSIDVECRVWMVQGGNIY
jgi:hypothetical protein